MFKLHSDYKLHLSPMHRDDLMKSGLTMATIEENQIHSVPISEMRAVLSKKLYEQVDSLLEFPYCEGFSRYKLFPAKDGFKYYQQPGSRCHLYVPHGVCHPEFITEGEKKALRATQLGDETVALGGLWNFNKEIYNQLKSMRVKKLWYIPDNDVWDRTDLMRSVNRFQAELGTRGIELIVQRRKSNGRRTR